MSGPRPDSSASSACIRLESGSLILKSEGWREQRQTKKEDEAVIAARAVLAYCAGNKVAAENHLQALSMQIALVRRFLKAVKS